MVFGKGIGKYNDVWWYHYHECELIKRIICLEVLDPITATATTTTTATKKNNSLFITLNDYCSTENNTKIIGSIILLFYAHIISNTSVALVIRGLRMCDFDFLKT